MTGLRTDGLRAATLAAVSTASCSGSVAVGAVEPYEYTKSAPLYTATLQIGDRTANVLIKDVTRGALLPGARKVKPAFLHHPMREVAMYRDVLPAVDGPAAYHGHHVDDATGRILLVIELVAGLELCDVGDLDVWAETARWLGAFHTSTDIADAAGVPIVERGPGHYRAWSERARSASRRMPARERATVRHVLEVYDREVIDHLLSVPATLVHGELYPSNVVIGGARADGSIDPSVRICPVDWESAGAGPALLDLAALTTGGWSTSDRRTVIAAYRDAAAAGGVVWDDFDRQLSACSLQLAVQWLGWFVDHEAPPWQARNWIEEAETAASQLC